jgi:hypothetical protein
MIDSVKNRTDIACMMLWRERGLVAKKIRATVTTTAAAAAQAKERLSSHGFTRGHSNPVCERDIFCLAIGEPGNREYDP